MQTQKNIKAALRFDSRLVEKGDIFFALRGEHSDGHEYIDQVIEKGASKVVCEVLPKTKKEGVEYVQVQDSAKALALAAAEYYDFPSSKLQLVGITGTNGKTTTATLLYTLFKALGYKVGLISTIQNKIDREVLPSTHTTPDVLRLNELLAKMCAEGCTHCFMEVSSHSVVQKRIAGLHFAGGVFTNLTHDHLDYHKTFEAYLKAKKSFFDELPQTSFALSNLDDRNGGVMLQNTKAHSYYYS